MTETVSPVYLNPAIQAEALADALTARGFATRVLKWREFREHPAVVVNCGTERHLQQTEYIFAGPNSRVDGEWWFYRVSPKDPLVMEKICPISQVSAAAYLLARTITVPCQKI